MAKGTDSKLYVSATILTGTDDATIDAHPWTEVLISQDLSGSNSNEEITWRTRESGGAEQSCPGGESNDLDVTLAYKRADSGLAIIENSFKNKTPIAIAKVDGEITAVGSAGTHGAVGNMNTFTFGDEDPIGAIKTNSFTFKRDKSNIFDVSWTHS